MMNDHKQMGHDKMDHGNMNHDMKKDDKMMDKKENKMMSMEGMKHSMVMPPLYLIQLNLAYIVKMDLMKSKKLI